MSSPSQPVAIRSSNPSDPTDTVPASFTGTPIGTPNLQALRAQYADTPTPPNIPPRGTGLSISRTVTMQSSTTPTPLYLASDVIASTSSPNRPVVGGLSATLKSSSSSGSDADSPPIDLDDLPAEEKAKVLRRHLVMPEERENDYLDGNGSEHTLAIDKPAGPTSRRTSASVHFPRTDSEPFPIPYNAHGADVTHDIYKWHAGVARGRSRAASFAGPSTQQDPAFEHIHEPGGFRRNYVALRAIEQGTEEPRMLSNFIDFLYIFGHFAGEDLEEEEEDKEEDEEARAAEIQISRGLPDVSEESPLLGKQSVSRSRTRRRGNSVGRSGTATATQAALMLTKSFVGTGVLFLGRAFYNGGLLFSIITFVAIAVISLYSFLLLLKTKFVVSGSFGDIGGTLYGPWMRYVILGSIVISQIGFVAAYTIFVAQNFQAFVMGITNCLKLIPMQYFILLQLIIFIPLALVRDIAKLSGTALAADVFILAGLVYIFSSEISLIADRGYAEVKMFNPKDFPLFVGTAVFSFEGIGLVIPITDSMREPHKFPAVLTGVMAFVTLLFGGAGALGYLTFGSDIETVVLVNLETNGMVQAVRPLLSLQYAVDKVLNPIFTQIQFLYAFAILLSIPLQFFPAVRIIENGLFTRSGKADPRVKWLKNAFRFGGVMVCTGISWVGAADLDNVPLCYVYPAMLHYRACAHTKKQKVADILLMVFGTAAFLYTTQQTIKDQLHERFW
ncbi:hypothetical protein H0H87_003703 [Tephrocybe sp. NHM501043]|nr:hypothetical protein H0H87_003703 [Tephrocybe sp. NHM501043]